MSLGFIDSIWLHFGMLQLPCSSVAHRLQVADFRFYVPIIKKKEPNKTK